MADIDEEFAILDVRLGQFLNLWTILIDYFSGTYVPSIEYKAIGDNDYRYPATFPWAMMSLLYSFFQSGGHALKGPQRFSRFATEVPRAIFRPRYRRIPSEIDSAGT